MRTLVAENDTFWFTYQNGVLHTGMTNKGLQTSTNAKVFEYGDDMKNKLAPHIKSIKELTVDSLEPSCPGVYKYQGKVVLLPDDNCKPGCTLYDAVKNKLKIEL